MSEVYLELTSALALTAVALILARWSGWLSADVRGRRQARWASIFVITAALVPLNGLSAARLLLTLSPSLSVSTLAFSIAAINRTISVRRIMPRAELTLLSAVVLAASIPLFASVLRLWPLDLYAVGDHFSWLNVTVAIIGAAAAWRGYSAVASVILGALVALFFHLLPSRNLWDALTDGLAFVVATAFALRAFAGWLASRQQRPV